MPCMCACVQGPTASFAPEAVTVDVYESDRQARLKVQLSSAPMVPVSVSYTVLPGTASATSDFRLPAGQIQFAAGETSKVRAGGRGSRGRAGTVHARLHNDIQMPAWSILKSAMAEAGGAEPGDACSECHVHAC